MARRKSQSKQFRIRKETPINLGYKLSRRLKAKQKKAFKKKNILRFAQLNAYNKNGASSTDITINIHENSFSNDITIHQIVNPEKHPKRKKKDLFNQSKKTNSECSIILKEDEKCVPSVNEDDIIVDDCILNKSESEKNDYTIDCLRTNEYPKSWTKEMIDYYSIPDEKLKNFDYVEILNNMKGEPSEWKINNSDRSISSKKRHFIRCSKCHGTGHLHKHCTKYLVCYVCGEFSHSYSNCPNTLCFTCGRATQKYMKNCRFCRKAIRDYNRCELCGQLWHEKRLCPSKWRQFSVLPFSKNGTLRPNSRKYCYNCAQKGHFGFECPQALDSDYPPENPFRSAFLNTSHEKQQDVLPLKGQGDQCDIRYRVIFLSKKTSELLFSEKGNDFLKTLSNQVNSRIELFGGARHCLKLFANGENATICKNEIFKWAEAQTPTCNSSPV